MAFLAGPERVDQFREARQRIGRPEGAVRAVRREHRHQPIGVTLGDRDRVFGEELLDLIKDMYNDGDADTRRAISQAWTKASEKAGRGDSLKDSDMDEFSKRFDRSFCKEHKG